jgi:HTH-like domain
MTIPPLQGELTIERMCVLAGVSRAGYYRHWAASAPRVEETAVRDAIQRLALAHRHYGYRRISAQLRREGLAVNRKRVLRLMQQDNLLCLRQRPFVPVTTDSRHTWRVVPNLARGMVPSGLDQLWVADITYIRLQEEFAYLAIVLQPARGRLGFGNAPGGAPGDRRTRNSAGGATANTRQPDPPLRPRHPIRLRRLHRPTSAARHCRKHEPGRQSLRQCQGRELHEDPQAGGGQRTNLP